MKRKCLIIVAILAVACWASGAWALDLLPNHSVSFSATGTFNGVTPAYPLSASVTFGLSADGHTLTIDLANTASTPVKVPQEVLTGLLWCTTSALGSVLPVTFDSTTITPVDEPAGIGTTLTFFNPSTAISSFKSEWGYGDTSGGGSLPTGFNRFLSSFDDPTTLYPGGSVDAAPPNVPDGLDYGLVGTGGLAANANADVTGNPLVQNGGHFTIAFSDALGSYNLDPDCIRFQYGTAFSDVFTRVPLPPSVLLMGSGLLGVGLVGWRRRRQQA